MKEGEETPAAWKPGMGEQAILPGGPTPNLANPHLANPNANLVNPNPNPNPNPSPNPNPNPKPNPAPNSNQDGTKLYLVQTGAWSWEYLPFDPRLPMQVEYLALALAL